MLAMGRAPVAVGMTRGQGSVHQQAERHIEIAVGELSTKAGIRQVVAEGMSGLRLADAQGTWVCHHAAEAARGAEEWRASAGQKDQGQARA